MKKISFLLIILTFVHVYAQSAIGVTEFYNYSKTDSLSALSGQIQDTIFSQLHSLHGIALIDKSQISSAMAQNQFSIEALSSDINVKKLGEQLDASIIITGNFEYNKITKYLRMNAKVVDVASGLIIDSETVIDLYVYADDLKKNIAVKLKDFIKQHYGLTEIKNIPAENQTAVKQTNSVVSIENISDLIKILFESKSKQNQSASVSEKNIVSIFYQK